MKIILVRAAAILVISIVCCGTVVAVRGEVHQDAVCWSGIPDTTIALIANDVAVHRSAAKFVVVWPDGRRREFLTGSCQWAPHDPEREYRPEDIQTWKGDPEDYSVMWASL